ncbi:DNA-binding transcriptional regulator, LysR family [Nocardia amikacinitolerans]|uniref:DNA-binding transcriptional regulator, LysR family n=1 Tax=Nocardia amikacinitolerans TaxID=756689 RepID=A0A285L5M4_9NOCA|nr:LysR substrate-binding domain-containing protein [Nocardia amikacinitolerans]MCP2280882.1 DNA-binding transcriptional regulator, LysR family [Nocardia amikacinitolerans]MCP2299805.1 DNA-binding transcriptional regulator, LysR family [Nocardia amikacinitolerans]SNY80218.1 DNA-binding transcriptional regulator, LysR family [Nocardia amikacinitolerans]
MELRHLMSFLALAEELHFGRAAQRLHLTQPSLSAQLRKLEKSLGVQLVSRNSHEVKLTPAGREFEGQARLIVAQLDRAAEITKAAAAGHSGSLNVGYNLPASRHVLPDALARMAREHPDVTVSLWEKRTGPQLAALNDGTLDVGLVYGHPHTAAFRYRPLLQRIPLVAVVGRTHRWAGRSGVRFAELAEQRCVLFAREQCPAMYDSIFRAAADNRIGLDVAQTADDPGATAHMVSVRPFVGFASLPRAQSMNMGGPDSGAVAVKLLDPVPTLDLFAVWRAEETNPAVGLFLDAIEAPHEQTVPV